MALRRLSFTSSAASNWKPPPLPPPPPPPVAPGPRTSESWGLKPRSGEAGPRPPPCLAALPAKWQPEQAGLPGQGK